jgi:hypothetical protein
MDVSGAAPDDDMARGQGRWKSGVAERKARVTEENMRQARRRARSKVRMEIQ